VSDEPNFARLCANCTHHQAGDGTGPWVCTAPVQSPLTGETYVPLMDCWKMREWGQPCGPGGRLFEERPA
jgi:hypothetical protein